MPTEVPWKGSRPVQVDWGTRHSLVLDEEGSVWEAGKPGSKAYRPFTFRRVPKLPLITMVAAGVDHSAALDVEGSLWVWTKKKGLTWASQYPRKIGINSPLSKVACGDDFLVGESEEGLLVLGNNSQGQLGLGHCKAQFEGPALVQVNELSKGPLRSLTAFYGGTVLVDSEGELFFSGDTSYGQYVPSGAPACSSVFKRIMPGIPPILGVTCGLFHALALDETGGVWSWGADGFNLPSNTPGFRSHPVRVTSLEGVRDVVAGAYHSLAFPSEGGLLVFGRNSYGQLGLDHCTDLELPTICDFQPSLPHCWFNRQKSARPIGGANDKRDFISFGKRDLSTRETTSIPSKILRTEEESRLSGPKPVVNEECVST